MKDPYNYLKNKEEAIKYFKKQNQHVDQYMKDTRGLRQEIFTELKSRVIDYQSPKNEKDGYEYYYKTFKEKQYPVYYRKKDSEEIILDENELSQGSKSFLLVSIKISEDHKLLAYLFNREGSDHYELEIKNLETKKVIFSKKNVADFEWYKDHFLYLKPDETLKPYKLYKANFEKEELLYEEKNKSAYLTLSKSKDKTEIYLNSNTKDTNEVRIYNGVLKLFKERKKDINYNIENWHGKKITMTNEENKNYDVFLENKKILSAEKGEIEDFEVFKDYLVIIERYLQPRIRILNLNTLKEKKYVYESQTLELEGIIQDDFEAEEITLVFSTLKKPEEVIKYNLRTSETKKISELQIPNYNPDDYEEEIFYVDQIPVSRIYNKRKRTKKAILNSYGSYGVVNTQHFRKNILVLLNRGFNYYIAHVRGGGELGREWYEQGKFLNKKNTFKDFIKVTEYLIKNNYTTQNDLIITGGSAGGLLIGAVINERPELYKAAMAHVPFVDVLNTMLDETLPLTTLEFEEWGNPKEKKFYDYIKSYSPYDNVKEQHYPNLLITTSLNDTRVGYWEPAKWHAKLKDYSTNPNIFLKTNLEAGHAGYVSRDDMLKEISYEYAFIIKQ